MTNFLSNILVSDSHAQSTAETVTPATTSVAPSTPSLAQFVPLILIFFVFYFLLIRPQQKKMKEHQNTLNALKNGDKVYTNGGIYGVVKSIDSKENFVELEIADNVVIKILKQNISSVIADKNLVQKPHKKK